MSVIKVACCQLAPKFGAVAENLAQARLAIMQAVQAEAKIIVLPELANTGYVFNNRQEAGFYAETLDGPSVDCWAALACLEQIIIVAGFCEPGPAGQVFNSAVLLEPSGHQTVYRKVHLWDNEKNIFDAGDQAPPVITTDFRRLAVMICYDLEFPEWVRLPALAGAELLCAPVNWPAAPRPQHERPTEVIRVQAQASVNRMAIAACDRWGAEREVDWVGGSVIVDADGYPRALAKPAQQNQLLVAEINLADSRHKAISTHNHLHADRRTDLYKILSI